MSVPNYTLKEALTAYNNDPVMTTNMWYVSFTGLDAIGQPAELIGQSQIYGKGFVAPSRTLTYESVNYRGYEIPTPTNLQMNHQHSIDIIADSKGLLRNAFLNWQAQVIDPFIDGQDSSFAADRRPTAGVGGVNCHLALLAPDMKSVTTIITMYGFRPESVGDLTLTNDAGGVATFQVQFQSVYWQHANPAAFTEIVGLISGAATKAAGVISSLFGA